MRRTSTRRISHIVAVKIEGEIQVHSRGAIGDYDTLCGIDADDPAIGHQGIAELPKEAKITCGACYQIFCAAWKLRETDFTAECKRKVQV